MTGVYWEIACPERYGTVWGKSVPKERGAAGCVDKFYENAVSGGAQMGNDVQARSGAAGLVAGTCPDEER